MTEKTPAEQLAALPDPASFDCLEEKFIHEGSVFRKGNKYLLEDYAHLGKDEVFMFWRAGWVSVEGWPEPPPRNPNMVIKLDVHNVRHLGKSPKLGVSRG
jgi:hypothetical protein